MEKRNESIYKSYISSFFWVIAFGDSHFFPDPSNLELMVKLDFLLCAVHILWVWMKLLLVKEDSLEMSNIHFLISPIRFVQKRPTLVIKL